MLRGAPHTPERVHSPYANIECPAQTFPIHTHTHTVENGSFCLQPWSWVPDVHQIYVNEQIFLMFFDFFFHLDFGFYFIIFFDTDQTDRHTHAHHLQVVRLFGAGNECFRFRRRCFAIAISKRISESIAGQQSAAKYIERFVKMSVDKHAPSRLLCSSYIYMMYVPGRYSRIYAYARMCCECVACGRRLLNSN